MSKRETLDQMLGWLDAASTRFRPKDSGLVDRGLQAAELYAEVSSEDRCSVSKEISAQLGRKLLSVSGFMAEKAINSNEGKWVRGALLLHLINDFRDDYRDNFRYLVLVNYASNKIGLSMGDMIDSVIPFASNRSRDFLRDFSKRDDKLNELACFGVREDVVDGMSKFVPS